MGVGANGASAQGRDVAFLQCHTIFFSSTSGGISEDAGAGLAKLRAFLQEGSGEQRQSPQLRAALLLRFPFGEKDKQGFLCVSLVPFCNTQPGARGGDSAVAPQQLGVCEELQVVQEKQRLGWVGQGVCERQH
ncbi:hypothetical protein KIL84_004474 [Mauremys mutica]|uniref:Uncharacterized protein n=1 Tax=Mauremys mutica TaxID=74926 RepID=A0A9D4B023_9SAUR|nr:hypothetical protein KIL84_004474 [Mauremys mutica]